jgi:DNA-binding transcriptional LysR family regulator
MDHHSIQTFLTVARTRNVSQAAEHMNLSQSAVSKRLKMLEQELEFCCSSASGETRAFR